MKSFISFALMLFYRKHGLSADSRPLSTVTEQTSNHCISITFLVLFNWFYSIGLVILLKLSADFSAICSKFFTMTGNSCVFTECW